MLQGCFLIITKDWDFFIISAEVFQDQGSFVFEAPCFLFFFLRWGVGVGGGGGVFWDDIKSATGSFIRLTAPPQEVPGDHVYDRLTVTQFNMIWF